MVKIKLSVNLTIKMKSPMNQNYQMKIYYSICSNINELYKIVIQGKNRENRVKMGNGLQNKSKGENFSRKRIYLNFK